MRKIEFHKDRIKSVLDRSPVIKRFTNASEAHKSVTTS